MGQHTVQGKQLHTDAVCSTKQFPYARPTLHNHFLNMQRDKPLGSEAWFNPEAVTEQKVIRLGASTSQLHLHSKALHFPPAVK
mgnify:CR=1 FL=1